MTTKTRFTFPKEEHLSLKKEIDLLFGKSDFRLNKFPLLLLVRMRRIPGPVRVLISVPKRKIRSAVKRNKVRRRISEAYRLNKSLLYGVLPDNMSLDLAVLYTGTEVESSEKITSALISLINDTGKRIPEIH